MKVSPITVGQYYTNSAIDNALETVNQAKGIFVPYAKKYGVTVDVDRAAKMVSPDLLTPSMQKLVDNNIVVSVRDKKTGKTGLSLVELQKTALCIQKTSWSKFWTKMVLKLFQPSLIMKIIC